MEALSFQGQKSTAEGTVPLFPNFAADRHPPDARSDGKGTHPAPNGPHLSSLNGAESPPTAPHEAEPGHTYRLAKALREKSEWQTGGDVPHRPWPDQLDRVPVPDELLDNLDELKGTTVRAALLLIRLAYNYNPSVDEWRASSRYWTLAEIEKATPHGCGVSRRSLLRAVHQLAERGWARIKKGGKGKADAVRWRMSAPRDRYTPLPTALLDTHPLVSHSELKVWLAIYRATWGWTKRDDGQTVHRLYARLSAGDLEAMTGLTSSTTAHAAKALHRRGAVQRGRPHRGSAWFYYPTGDFFSAHHDKSKTPTSRDRCVTSTPPPEEHSESGRSGPKNGAARHTKGIVKPRSLGEKKSHFDTLTSGPFDLHRKTAFRLCSTRSVAVLDACIDAYDRQKADIDNPSGWIRLAIEKLWYGPRTRKQTPNRNRRNHNSTRNPIAQAFKTLSERCQGWEWEAQDTTTNLKPPPSADQQDSCVGLTHTEMCDVIDALHQPPGSWQCTRRKGRPNVFIPDKELARWAWHNRDALGTERARRAAKRLIEIRKKYEGIR
jgi:hypothetical protein